MQVEIHEKLKMVRLDKKLSQENIAEELKIDATTYGRYEKGEVPIKFEQVLQLATFYKMSIDEIIGYGTGARVSEPKPLYSLLSVPITVLLDGRDDTLEQWISKLKKLNAAI